MSRQRPSVRLMAFAVACTILATRAFRAYQAQV
jgi:hypothetical protein